MLRQMLATTNDLTFTVARLIRSSQIRGKNNKSQRSLQPAGAALLSFGSGCLGCEDSAKRDIEKPDLPPE